MRLSDEDWSTVTWFRGQVCERVEGFSAGEMAAAVRRLLDKALAPSTTSDEGQLSSALQERLRRLTHSARVMLFMKGMPDAPRCGFSRQVVEILRNSDIPFASFDILSDEEVRNGLKTFSEWPTYPQLYVNGALIGGLDIVKEMASDPNVPLSEQLGLSKDPIVPQPQESSLEDRIRRIMSSDKVVLFMKGSPSEPKCGFSRNIVQILQSEGVVFTTFDVLSDEDVRAGLKILSEWPTYPQLYVNSELVGGLDIVQDMLKAGPLKPQLESIGTQTKT